MMTQIEARTWGRGGNIVKPGFRCPNMLTSLSAGYDRRSIIKGKRWLLRVGLTDSIVAVMKLGGLGLEWARRDKCSSASASCVVLAIQLGGWLGNIDTSTSAGEKYSRVGD